MNIGTWTNKAAFAAALLLVTAGTSAWADGEPTDVAAELKALKARIAELEAKENTNWLSEERTAQIRGIVEEVLADVKKRNQSNTPDFGYNNGFYIQSPDGNYKLQVNGLLQFRYVYSRSEVRNRDAFGSNVPPSGDASAFGFRRARLYFSGNVFDPNLIYMISGDFGGSSSNSGNFQILDTYLGYNFTPALKIKGGAMKIPFTYAELYSSGLMAPEAATTAIPFDAVRTLGLSLYGDIIKDKLNYEVQINDGSKSNSLGRPADASGALDNRYGFYGRMEWAGNGNMKELRTESDFKGSKDFIWMLGVAAGYEEQNSQSNAFPRPQTSLALLGLSSNTSPGFVASQTVNGSLFRATTDFHAKYRGLSFGATGYMQYLNDELPAGATTDSFRNLFGKSSIGQAGYVLQAGYMVIPQKLELIGRFGQLMTFGLPNRMEEYTLGVNYFLYGSNAKIQLGLTYIPNEAAFSDSGANTIQNTQDLIMQAQFHLEF
ncbi:MAG: OprO/OprP family phosphate-selective porin [Phycisphaerales bacterium]|nr:OprO/OprP family phosphate-selective porin [Phycisphaerales bacterium]